MAYYNGKNRSRRWAITNSLWMICSVVIYLNWVGFFYISRKAHRESWMAFGFLYLFIVVGDFFVLEYVTNRLVLNIWSWVFIAGWMASIIQSILLRKSYLNRLAALEDEKGNEREVIPPRQEVKTETKAEVKIEVKAEKIKSVNLNNCTEQQLADLPGVSIAQAKRAVAIRREIQGFASVEDFITRLKIRPHFKEQIEKCAFVSSIGRKASDVNDKSRLVDI